MSLPFYISKMEGETHGAINGSVTQKGREKWILCEAFEHKVSSPRDIQTGMATGKRLHGPLKIVKFFDKSTPILFDVLTNNESLKSVEVTFFRVPPKGGEEKYYTITLTNANISEIRAYVPNALDKSNGSYGDMEEVSFVYEKIEWTYLDGGIMAMDSWQEPGR